MIFTIPFLSQGAWHLVLHETPHRVPEHGDMLGFLEMVHRAAYFPVNFGSSLFRNASVAMR